MIKNVGKVTKENVLDYIDLLHTEKENILKQNFDKAIKILEKEFEMNSNLFGKHENFDKFIINLFTNKYKQVNNDNYREKIIELILKDNKLIKNSKTFFYLFFRRFNLYPNEREDKDFLSFVNKNNKILNLINEKCVNNIILEEILLSVFDDFNLFYFNNLKHKNKEEKINYHYLINDLSFSYFTKSFEFINNNSKNKLGFFYSISYIKIYLYNFVEICYDKNKICNFKEITNYIYENNNIKFMKTIKLYILKVFRIIFMKSFQEFNDFNVRKYEINWKNEFVKIEKNNFQLDYIFLNN
jgi:hypothetical protein